MADRLKNPTRSAKILTFAVVLLILFAPNFRAEGIIVTSPPRSIQTGDITTTSILDGTILNADVSHGTTFVLGRLGIATGTPQGLLTVSASTTFAALVVQQGTDNNSGPLIVAQASTTERLRLTNDGKLGLSTSTPAQTLSVQGNALVSGALSAASVTATGTITADTLTANTTLTTPAATINGLTTTDTLSVTGGATTTSLQVAGLASTTSQNVSATTTTEGLSVTSGNTRLRGVNYRWPTADGTSGQVLRTNGAGALSFATLTADWVELAATTTTAAMTNLDIPITASSSVFMLLVEAGEKAGAGYPVLQFNEDAGVNYSWRKSANGAADGTATGDTYIPINQVNSTKGAVCGVQITNRQAYPKFVISQCLRVGAALAVPDRDEVVGMWSASTTEITTIRFRDQNSSTWPIGTHIRVLGAKN